MQSAKRLSSKDIAISRTASEKAMMDICKLLHARGYSFEVYRFADETDRGHEIDKYSVWVKGSGKRMTLKDMDHIRSMCRGIELLRELESVPYPDITILQGRS